MEGRSFPRPFGEGKIFFLGEISVRNLKNIFKKLRKRAAGSIGGPVGEPAGGSFTGNFERKRESLSWSLFFEPEDIKILILGAIWMFSKEQGSLEQVSNYRTQRA